MFDRKGAFELGAMTHSMMKGGARDSVTGVLTQIAFQNRVLGLMTQRDAVKNPLTVIYIALPVFSKIQVGQGQAMADELLRRVAQRLTQLVGENIPIGCFPQGQFALAIEGSAEKARETVYLLKQAFLEPLDVLDQSLMMNPVIGAATCSKTISSAAALVRAAELAMLEHHGNIDPSSMVLDDKTYLLLTSRRQIAIDLSHAIARGEIQIVYQPVYSLTNGKISGAEALLRWHHPTLGLLQAGDFLRIAEESGLILELGERALLDACTQAKRWQHEAGRSFRITVNLSPNQLSTPGIADVVRAALTQSQLSPASLELDIDSRASGRREAMGSMNIAALRELGISLAMDDFGSGNSSMSDLLEFQPGRVKLARTLIKNLPRHAPARNLIRGLCSTFAAMGIAVHAKAVESQSQLNFLCNAGCESAQGFFFSAPADAAAFDQLLGSECASSTQNSASNLFEAA